MKSRLQLFFRSAERIGFLAAVMVSIPLIFRNAIIHDFPMGYAGLFTQMAQQVAEANFVLPAESPYYGPGGIPFAYPPFGLYLLAVFIKITGKYFIFLRWLPPLFGLVSVCLTYLLAQKFFKLPFASMTAAILAAASLDLHTAHIWSSGIVRGSAFIFTILFMIAYSSNPELRTPRRLMVSSLFFGLAVLSHLAYGLFCFFWLAAASFSIRHWKKSLIDTVSTGLGAGLLASVWVLPVASLHGWDVFWGALNSHGGNAFFVEAVSISGLIRLLYINLTPLLSNPLLAGLVVIGIFYLLRHGYFRFVFFFLLVTLFFPENARFVSWLGCFTAGYGLWSISDRLCGWGARFVNVPRFIWIVIVMFPALALLWLDGFSSVGRFTPLLTESALDLQAKRSEVFQDDGRYLALLIQDEAEWMPFLLELDPLVSQWGSEWLGDYDEQTRLMSLFQTCRKEKDWACVNSALNETGAAPRFIITYRIEEKLNEQISADDAWAEIYANRRYIVWQVVEAR